MYLETARLILKPMEEKDDPALAEILLNREVSRTYMVPEFENKDHCMRLVRRIRELSRAEDRFVAGVYLDGQLIGLFNDVELADSAVEMGYVIAPAHWNRGYATEALQGVIRYLHGAGFREVITGAFEENPASLRVMVKAGMEKLDRTDAVEYRGRVHNCVYYVAK